MKIVHLHKFGNSGGSGGAISMRRLNAGLIQAGVDSRILCVDNTEASASVISCPPSRIERKLNKMASRWTKGFGLDDILNVNAKRIRNNPFFREADVVNFHRIPDVFSYLSLPRLTRDKPGVYTLCDMWALTGHCRNSLDCERWKTGCGKCPITHLPPVIKHDMTALHWKLKKAAYEKSNITIVAKARFLADLARESMLGCFPIHNIPNGIDTDLYKPIEQEECRSLLKIPQGKKVFICGAQNFERHQKGSDLLVSACRKLPEALKADIVLLTFGNGGEMVASQTGLASINLGYISDDKTKVSAFSAADALLLPSRAEVFPNMALESLACGTPVVAFDTCGNPDMVRHGVTGYLAEPENPLDFSAGMVRLLDDDVLREKMSKQGRELAVKEFRFEIVVQKYIDLYQSLPAA
jgi:glycosyltransferase involved in cell wall biosynthesis